MPGVVISQPLANQSLSNTASRLVAGGKNQYSMRPSLFAKALIHVPLPSYPPVRRLPVGIVAVVRAGAQMQPSPPIMTMPSDSTVPPPSEAIFVPPGPAAAGAAAPPQGYATSPESYTWQLLPDGLMYPSYLAGEREPRIGSEWVYDQRMGWIWNIAMGARVGLLRFGNEDKLLPEGFQFDLEAAAFPRLIFNYERDRWRSTFVPAGP